MRDITPDMENAFSSALVQPAYLAELYFDSDTLRIWSGVGTLSWNGKDFIGGGNLVAISDIEENQGLEARGIVATLGGVPSNLVGTALAENARGRPFRLYLAVVDSRGKVLVEDGDNVLTEDGGLVLVENELLDNPYRIFSGLMDTMDIVDTGELSTISVTVESIMIVGQRNKVSRYTNEEQKKRFPSDRGLEFINQLQDKEIVW